MYNVRNRVPTDPNKFKLLRADGSSEDVILTRNDSPTVAGTNVNRELLMSVQGMESGKTTFNSDGSITETYATGKKITTFNADGSIKEKFTGNDGTVISKTTTFNEDGSITEEVD